MRSLSLYLSLSLTHTLSLSHSISLSHTHTLSLSHTHFLNGSFWNISRNEGTLLVHAVTHAQRGPPRRGRRAEGAPLRHHGDRKALTTR